MQFDPLKRRDFIALPFVALRFGALVGGAEVWPLGTRAQQPARPVIGYLAEPDRPMRGAEWFGACSAACS